MPRKTNKNYKDLYGLIFVIEMSCFYILDRIGDICIVSGNKDEIAKLNLNLNEVYKIQDLYFNGKDKRCYSLYDIRKKTKFIKIVDGDINIFKKFAIIRFIILDNNNINKTKSKIKVRNQEIYIRDTVQYAISYKDDNSSYYLEEFNLKIKNESKTFNLFIYKGEINNINCCLIADKKSKCYEIIYLSKKIENLPNQLNISGYIIKDFDKFSCTHRIRFNIMNVRKDNNFYIYDDNLSSYEIIFLIDEYNKETRYGIFNVKSVRQIEGKQLIGIKKFSKFINGFFENYDINFSNDNNYNAKYFLQKKTEFKEKNFTDDDLENFNSLMDLDIYQYPQGSLDDNDYFIFFKNYCFFKLYEFGYNRSTMEGCSKYLNFLTIIQNYSNFNKIRLLLAFTNLVIEHGVFPSLININNLNDDHPYKLATQFQKDIISNFSEKSNIFYPIIQFNSKMLEILPDNLFDYLKMKINCFKIEKKLAYTISLENLKEMKNHLTNLQEDFFFIFEQQNYLNFYGLYILKLRIMCVNQFVLCKDIFSCSNAISSKNYAFGINMVFSHERMCHGKESLCNPGIPSPNIYFNINFKRVIFNMHDSFYNKDEGEAGRIFESFIADQYLIKVLKDKLCFGKFLDYNYFIGDFKDIKKEAFDVLSTTYFYKVNKIIKFIICFLGILFHFYIFYLLKKIFEIERIFNIILYISTFLILAIISYKFYNNKTIININIFNYDIIDKKYEEKEGKKILIFPDDYPVNSNSLFGRLFDCLNCRKNKIRRKLAKYALNEYEKYDTK